MRDYTGYTDEGIDVIRIYLERSGDKADHFRPSGTDPADHELDAHWLAAYRAGQRSRYIVVVEQFEGAQQLKAYGRRMRWTLPEIEYRVVVRDLFQNNLVWSVIVKPSAAASSADMYAERFGFKRGEDDD